MSFVCQPYVTCMSLVCHSYVFVCYLYATRMYSHVMACHSYVLVYHPYFIHMYSYIIRISLVCTRITSVCHSYVLICHQYVTRMYSHVIGMSLVCDFIMNQRELLIELFHNPNPSLKTSNRYKWEGKTN